MSYDIYFRDAVSQEIITLPYKHQLNGATYCLGGTDELSFNITFNYGGIYNQYGFYVPQLSGLTAVAAMPILEGVISRLDDDVTDNYWEATEGNAKKALVSLLTMCQLKPDAVIDVRY